MRREFQLPEEDEQFAEGLGLPWETVKEGETRWLVVHNWPVPPGYNHSLALAGLILPASYPDGPIDMVYFYPHLSLTCGKGINNLTPRPFDGKEWQQWSRHRTEANPWRAGVDNVAIQFGLVDHCNRPVNRFFFCEGQIAKLSSSIHPRRVYDGEAWQSRRALGGCDR